MAIQTIGMIGAGTKLARALANTTIGPLARCVRVNAGLLGRNSGQGFYKYA
jgi:3-hydroxyacyl-CoA dehydrogenase